MGYVIRGILVIIMQYIDKHMYKPVHRVRNIVEADNLDIMGLHLNTLLYIEYLPGHIDKAHTHDFWHLFYVTKGEGVIAINDIEEEVCSGHIAIVHPFHEHYFRNISGGITSVVEIKWEYSDQVIEVFSPPACSGFFRDRYGLRQYINRIIEEIVHQPIGWKLILKAIVFELLV
ncbi:MAG TPA: cupin domain-containing protein [Firmicutes bacterium]|nr:cupin domain-containing protein [Bacillota bacterium]